MAWKDTLLDASFRGVTFDVQRTADTIERDTAHYAVPHVDGEDIRDLGLKAHDVSLTAIVFGDDYEHRLKALLAALSVKGPGELIHPVFGSLPNMQFMGGHVTHDAENVDACQIEMRFKRATPSNPFFVERQAGQAADAAAHIANGAQQAGLSMFEKALGALKLAKAGLRRLNALRSLLSDTLGPIKALVAGFRSTALDYLTFPGAFASDLIGLVSSIGDFRSFDRGLIMADWTDVRHQMHAIVKLPAAVASGQSVAVSGPTTIALVHPNGRAAGAAPIGSRPAPSNGHTGVSPVPSVPPASPFDPAAPYMPKHPRAVAAVEVDVKLVTSIVATVVANVTTNIAVTILVREAEKPTLAPHHVEQIANDTRILIQIAIDAVREAAPIEHARAVIEPLKDTALAVQQLAIQVIDVLPPIVTRSVDVPTNLTLLAHRWYGDYRRAAELLRLNPHIRNPNFIARAEVLHGFAQ
ncbi:DNA circularization protein [Burkholderia cepacia]|uniref:DNA circularization protein n=1 Tax=Burkholderia cepacia TaxID=292 RepID=UPI0007569BC2|nr:DNA circularization N-terminal domain-containing protein [Burkholderia cepacia]KWH56298.1 multidrug DMT transporter permease [Burkholderia cepacia]